MPLRRPLGLLALAAMVVPLLAHAGPVSAQAPAGSPVFINEIHYDNAGADVGEFVEVVGPAGTDLTGWSVVPYNGNGGTAYTPVGRLTGVLPDSSGSGYGVQTVSISGLQNGAPDGAALVDGAGSLVQFLSYEGAFTATDGPAAGVFSTAIGVVETGAEPSGQSLQLTGTGATYGDFTWVAAAAQTPGAVNVGQVFPSSGDPARPVATCPATLPVQQGSAAYAELSATDADSRVTSASITAGAVDGISLEDVAASPAEGQPGTATLTVADTVLVGVYTVEITFANDDDQFADCAVDVAVQAPLQTTPVSAVQGSGAASPLVGQEVAVQAVVTSLFTRQDVLDGFFVQEEDADQDGDPATSEGLFVFCRGACPEGLAGGDLVALTGTVAEFFGMTQLDVTSGDVDVVSSGVALPAATSVALPAVGSTEAAATLESLEGMHVVFPGELVVSEYFELARYGQLVLTADARPYQFTQRNAPDETAFAAAEAELATRRIILDDDNNDQNDAITGPESNEAYPYPTPGLSLDDVVRGGDATTGLTGVLHWSFAGQSRTDAWRVRPVAGKAYTFAAANERTEAPPEVGGSLKVASFNVLNYFATIDTTSSGSTGPCGPSGTADCRGADSEAERVRQLDKIVAALSAIDADVYGLIEIQNDDGLATEQIVDALNAAYGRNVFGFVDTGVIGTDAIKQAFVYKRASVTPVNDFETLDSADDPRFVDTRNRPALVQTFQERATGERVTVAVNHFKSKGSGCGAGDDSPRDGSGNCDGTRTQAAQALADFLATDPTGSGDPDFLVIGDLNSYAMERPITTLEAAGYVDLLEQVEGADRYGYVFDGQLGTLDYALANQPLHGQVTGASGWKINADEVPLFDYNDTVRDAGEAAFERKSTARELYAPDAYRSSDHDPVIVGLDLAGDQVGPGRPDRPGRPAGRGRTER